MAIKIVLMVIWDPKTDFLIIPFPHLPLDDGL